MPNEENNGGTPPTSPSVETGGKSASEDSGASPPANQGQSSTPAQVPPKIIPEPYSEDIGGTSVRWMVPNFEKKTPEKEG